MSQSGVARSRSFASLSPRERITRVVEGWFLTEPLLFAAWTVHDVVESSSIETIRVGHGSVEYNAAFIASLRQRDLRNVLVFEAMRILLGHPYLRKQPDTELAYLASNITVQECLRTDLPIPLPKDLLQDEQCRDQYFEYYYRELEGRSNQEPNDSPDQSDESGQHSSDPSDPTDSSDQAEQNASEQNPLEQDLTEQDHTEQNQDEPDPTDKSDDQSSDDKPSDRAEGLDAYADAAAVGRENAERWDTDDLQRDEIQAAVRNAAESGAWGSIGAIAKEQLLANLNPKLDYRGVLRSFRQSVLSVRRRLTRMKPSRRYGFAQMGSRYDFATRLLFAIDVSGSMTSDDLRMGFSVISKFFRYGMESVDVIWFDDQIRTPAMTLRRARSEFEVTGRGATSFQPVMDYIDQHPGYDGLIVFTDGYAPVPMTPQNKTTRILWLFKDESTYQQMRDGLSKLGFAAFLRAGRSV